MTAAPVTIVCANCGAKYKLPSDFKSASAKCKGCGATIDVAGQLRAAATPTEKEAIGAKAVAAPRTRPGNTRPGKAATDGPATEWPARGRASGSSSRREKPAAGSTRSRRGAEAGERSERAAKSGGSNKLVLIGSLVAVVALGIVGYFVMFAKNGEPAANTALAPDPSTKSVADAAMTKSEGAVDAAKAEADALAKELAGGTTEGDDTDAKTDAKSTEKEKVAAKPEPKPDQPLTAADVFDPRTLEPLAYPADLDDALRQEIESLCADVRHGGRSGIKAKARLEEIGHPAIVGVVNAYSKIDFKDPDQAMYAFELNKLLTNAFGAGVISTNFKQTQMGDPIPLETADWNAQTVKAWRRFWEMNSDKDKWENLVKARKEGKKPSDTEKDGDK